MQTTWLIYSSPDLNFQMRAVRPKAKRKLWIFHEAFFPPLLKCYHRLTLMRSFAKGELSRRACETSSGNPSDFCGSSVSGKCSRATSHPDSLVTCPI